MEPKKVGRTLGIGVRVAAKMVRERVSEASAAQAAAAASPRAQAAPPPVAAAAAQRVATAKRGVQAFGKALWGPFSHAGSVLWLEITGLFFALFGLFFAQSVYRVHTAWKGGPEHAHLVLYTLLTAGFLWFSFSSFARAYRKSRQGRSARP